MVGDEQLAGKSLGTDLDKQKLTLPIIRLLAQSDEPRRAEMLKLLKLPGGESRLALRQALVGQRRLGLHQSPGHLVCRSGA